STAAPFSRTHRGVAIRTCGEATDIQEGLRRLPRTGLNADLRGAESACRADWISGYTRLDAGEFAAFHPAQPPLTVAEQFQMLLVMLADSAAVGDTDQDGVRELGA